MPKESDIMKGKNLAIPLLVMAIIVTLASTVFAISGPYTVYARVVHGSGAIQAVLEPGEFTVPAGSSAVIKKFQHDDPNNGYHNEKLGKNIYSVTQGVYMADANGNGFMQLPAGQYRFVVGGGVGASGVLVYELHP